jgi:outer membrane protein assembly factor BamB
VAGTGLARLALADGSRAWTSADGRAVAPPVAAGDAVYTAEDDGRLRARDAATGATRWTFETGAPLAAPPVVDAKGRVLVGTTDRRFVSLDAKDGRKRWTWRIGADMRTPPALLDDLVVFAAYDDVLYALRAGNGHLAWRAALPSRPQSGPIVTRGAVLVACHGARAGETYLVGFDGFDGRRLGDLRIPGEARTPPLLVEGHLYVGLREKAVVGLQIGG